MKAKGKEQRAVALSPLALCPLLLALCRFAPCSSPFAVLLDALEEFFSARIVDALQNSILV